MIVADRQSEVVERGQRVAVFGLNSAQDARQVCLVGAVTAVVRDDQAPAQGVQRAVGICVAEGQTIGEERERKHIRVAGGFGGVDQTARGGHRLVKATGDRQCDDQACRGECVGVAAARELGATPLDPPFGLADDRVRAAEQPSMPNGTSPAAAIDNHLTGVAVADSRLDPSGL